MKRRTFVKNNLYSGVGLFGMPAMVHNFNKVKNMSTEIKVGFSKSSLVDCIQSNTSFRRPLEAIVCNFVLAETPVVLIALDLIYLLPHEHTKLQNDIASLCEMSSKNIVIHTTHTHSAPWDLRGSETSYTGLPELLSRLIKEAENNAQAATISFGKTDVGQDLSLYRRKDTGEDLGIQTFWLGFDYNTDSEKPDASLLINDMKKRWSGEISGYAPAEEKVFFDAPVDPLAQAIRFMNHKGETIGSIASFAAHPHLASACKENLFDPDYPAFVRETMEKEFGGLGMFLLAPCADLVPKEKIAYQSNDEVKLDKYYFGPTWAVCPQDEKELHKEMQRIGNDIGAACISGLKKAVPKKLDHVQFIGGMHSISLDSALPDKEKDIDKTKKMLMPEYESFLNQKAPLREMRRLANRINWLDWACTKYFSFTEEKDREAKVKEMPVSFLKVEDVIMVFIHSEITLHTSLKIREKFSLQKVVVISMTGGYIGYIPTSQMIDEGGYEGRSAIIAKQAEEELTTYIFDKVNQLIST